MRSSVEFSLREVALLRVVLEAAVDEVRDGMRRFAPGSADHVESCAYLNDFDGLLSRLPRVPFVD